ncbi:MAG: flagellar brake protein [Burkholderiaceae bacterium]|nr:MAG: flagellar brake protein [Burkholderiaceae bacterium]
MELDISTKEHAQYLRMIPPGATEGYLVQYFGGVEGRSLLVSAPQENGAPIEIHPGQLFAFKGFFGQSIYRFTARVLEVCERPYPYLHIEWPDPTRVEATVVRAHRRITLDQPCSVIYTGVHGHEQKISAHLSNLSCGGAEIGLMDALPEALNLLRLSFRVTLTEERYQIELNARIVGERHVDPNQFHLYRYGLCFEQAPRETHLLLYAFVQDQQLAALEMPPFTRK